MHVIKGTHLFLPINSPHHYSDHIWDRLHILGSMALPLSTPRHCSQWLHSLRWRHYTTIWPMAWAPGLWHGTMQCHSHGCFWERQISWLYDPGKCGLPIHCTFALKTKMDYSWVLIVVLLNTYHDNFTSGSGPTERSWTAWKWTACITKAGSYLHGVRVLFKKVTYYAG